MSAVTGHAKLALVKKGEEYSARLGLAGAHEGVILVMLERGHSMDEAESEASACCFQGGPMPLLSNSCQKAINSVVKASWASLNLKAQAALAQLAFSAANEKIRLDALKTILDRGGHGPVPLNADTSQNTKTTEELMAEAEELKQLIGD